MKRTSNDQPATQPVTDQPTGEGPNDQRATKPVTNQPTGEEPNEYKIFPCCGPKLLPVSTTNCPEHPETYDDNLQ